MFLAGMPVFAAQTVYSTIIEDLPLMPGMVERTNDAIVFDKPGGRIVETSAAISASAADIKKFYDETLPPLGWKVTGNWTTFTREGETLKLSLEKQDDAILVHFSLNPHHEGK